MSLINVNQITALHDHLTKQWHLEAPLVSGDGLSKLITGNHFNNFSLWHREDEARQDDKGFEHVYLAKRDIDKFNQARNDYMEKIDSFVVEFLNPPTETCPMHTETPGMIIDRLSILALKKYHMQEETLRSDVSLDHIQKCTHKHNVISKQLNDLAKSLDHFLTEVQNGTRGFQVYYQFKMYNDPTLNPQLYKTLQNIS